MLPTAPPFLAEPFPSFGLVMSFLPPGLGQADLDPHRSLRFPRSGCFRQSIREPSYILTTNFSFCIFFPFVPSDFNDFLNTIYKSVRISVQQFSSPPPPSLTLAIRLCFFLKLFVNLLLLFLWGRFACWSVPHPTPSPRMKPPRFPSPFFLDTGLILGNSLHLFPHPPFC